MFLKRRSFSLLLNLSLGDLPTVPGEKREKRSDREMKDGHDGEGHYVTAVKPRLGEV